MLHDAIATLLGDDVGTLVVVATDTWDTSSYPALRQECREQGVPWLPVRAELGRVVIGPVELPGTTGCGTCFELRRGRCRPNAEEHRLLFEQHGTRLAQRPSSWLTALGCDTVSTLVTDEMRRVEDGHGRTRNAVLYVDLEHLTVTPHRFLPEPRCPDCGSLPEDAPEELALEPRPKSDPGTYRIRRVLDDLDELPELYLDEQSGLLRRPQRQDQGGLAVATADLPRRSARRVETGTGRDSAYRSSELLAILEGLERWGGLEPGAKSTVVEARYGDLPGPAVDPSSLGTHPEQNYWIPGFPFRMFSEDQSTRWVWGYSFARHEPVLVPETAAYHGIPQRTAVDRPFVQELSNGCALGSSLEEAVLHGLLEVAERDAFLMTWYARLPAPRIDLRGARDREVPLRAAAISLATGYDVLAFDTTLENRIPCTGVMAVSPEDRDDRPKAVCAAGSHPTLEGALLDALGELGPVLAGQLRRFPADADRARRMAQDARLVATKADHATLYGAPEAFERLRFLVESPNRRELSTDTGGFGNGDLSVDLDEMLERYLGRGMDVVVVDQTGPEHRAGGFRCAKVLVPGALPLTYGHAHRRVEGLPRLYEVPRLLGHTSAPRDESSINPHPHPFP